MEDEKESKKSNESQNIKQGSMDGMALTEEQKERIKRNREKALERRKKILEQQQQQQNIEESVPLEDFEIDASPYVTASEAMKKYCLPQGTLDVCAFIEKDNPRNTKFSKMKLYMRSDIRKRARERWGGLEGLQTERRRRELNKFQKDLDDVKHVFKKSKHYNEQFISYKLLS
jgi:DNA-repair protein complementing XP-A cells